MESGAIAIHELSNNCKVKGAAVPEIRNSPSSLNTNKLSRRGNIRNIALSTSPTSIVLGRGKDSGSCNVEKYIRLGRLASSPPLALTAGVSAPCDAGDVMV